MDYHGDYSALAQSMLKVFAKRRRLFEAYYVAKSEKPPPPNRRMEVGTGSHAWILEPHRIHDLVKVIPEKHLSGANHAISSNAAKAWVAEISEAGFTVLKPKEMILCQRVAEAMCASEAGKWLQAATYREHVLRWTNLETRVDCRMRADAVVVLEDKVIGLDVKVTDDPSPANFERICHNMRAYIQDAHYREGLEYEFNKPAEFYFVAVEAKPPHAVAVHRYKRPEESDAKRLELIEALVRCHASGDWSEPWEHMVHEMEIKRW